jgi:hypothetical protein
MAIPTNGIQLVRISGAVFNQQLSASDYSEILAANRTAAELDAWANAAVAAEFKGKTTTDIAKAVLANVGLSSVSGLEAWVAGQLNAGGGFAKAGATLLTLLNDYSNMSTTDATYGASVATFNTKVDNSQTASQTAGTASGTYAAVSAVSAAAAKAAADKAAADKVIADAAAAAKVLTEASDKAAAAATKAIADATAADAAVTAAQTALTAATTKADLTNATALTAATTAATAASTAAAATKTAADAAVITAQTALTNAITAGVVNDINTANANLLIAQARATTAATSATTAATTAATAKTASDAATADDAAVVTAQTALNTAVTAATKAAADAVTAAKASATAAAATTATTDDTAAAAAATAAAATGAGAAKITADAAAAKVAADAAAAKVIADAAAAKVIADAAAAKVIADAAAAKVIADALAVATAPRTFTLTTGIDNGTTFTGGDGADTFNATHLTFGASDVLVGGSGIDTLTIVDTGTAAYQPAAATVSGVELINIRNLNTATAVTGVTEVATVTTGALVAGQTLVIAGQTLTATAAMTASEVGAALASTATAGLNYTLAGALSGYTKAAGTNTNQVVYTSSTANSSVTDLTLAGSAQTGTNQVQVLTFAGNAGNTDNRLSIVVNGVTVTSAAAGSADAAGLLAEVASLTAGINSAAGRVIATNNGALSVTIISPTPVTLGSVTTSGTANVSTGTLSYAPVKQTIAFATNPGATTAQTVYINGVLVTTATLAADTIAASGAAYVTAINAAVGRTVASFDTATLTIDNGNFGGMSVTGFGNGNTTETFTTVVGSGGVGAANSATVSIVQGVTAVTATGQTDTLVATNFTDATTFISDNSTGLVNITGLTAAQTAVQKAGSGGIGAGFGSTVTTGTVEINGGSTAGNVAITGGAFTTATINSTGAPATSTGAIGTNTIGTLTGAATTTSTTINATSGLTTSAATNLGATVTVTGAGNVSFGTTALESGVTTLNAAGLTGTLTVALGSAVTQRVTGGSGSDTISTGAVLTTGSVDAGAGSADVLVLTNATHLASATLAAKYTNFETLRINTGITQDMANAPASITAIQTMGVATVSNMTPAQAASVQMRTNATAGTADALNLQLASQSGTNDTLSITAGVGTTTTGALDIAALNVTGFEVLNLRANPGPSSTAGDGAAGDRTTNITGTITGATLNTVNLTGTAVNIANVAISGATAGVTINGSALTGDGLAAASQAGLTVAGSAFVGSTITGSAVRDVFTIGTEGSAYNGGGGNDSMTTTVAILVADGVTDGTLNGGDGNDTLVVSDTTTTLTDNHFTKLSNFELLTLSNTVGDASVTTGGAFNSAFANGATIVTGKLAVTKDIAFQGGLSTVPVTLTVDLDLVTGAATDVQTVVTGSAADTVTLNGDATYVGVAGANDQGTINISTGAGNDTISYTHGQLLANARLGVTSAAHQAVIINGGTGADTITKGTGSLNSTTVSSVTYFNMAAGDSGTTLATQDKITGFSLAGVATNTLSDVLNFEGTATVSSFSNSIDFGTILTHSITGGIVTFDTAATFASAKLVTASNLADVVGYLNANMGVNETVGFLFDSNGDGANDATMVFHQGSSLTTVADDLVQLVGTIGLSLNATLTTATAGAIAIA